MKNKYITLTLLFLGFNYMSAQTGIGTNNPNNSAQLEISATKRGLLIPRIALVKTTEQTPIVGTAVTSLLVFNTATINDVVPGFYYWDGTKWLKIARTDETTFASLTDEEKASLKGDTGAAGKDGTSVTIKGSKTDKSQLPTTGNALGDGYIIAGNLWVWDGTKFNDVGPIQGPKGDTGATGAAGATGPKGDTGAAGAVGATGATGPKGDTGAAGAVGATGATGAKGDTGATGAKGDTGTTGKDGTSVTIKGSKTDKSQLPTTGNVVGDGYIINGNLWVWDGTKFNDVGPIQGPKGDTGAVGATGATGPKGDTGATGAKGDTGAKLTFADLTQTDKDALKGVKGDTGATGAKGDTGAAGATGATGAKGDTGAKLTFADLTQTDKDALKGVKGDTGAAGATGATGPKGDTGAAGAVGATGATGPKGDTGAAGAVGATGAKGDTGAKLTFADLTQTDKDALKGVKGDTGATGAKGDTGAVGATGATGPKGDTGAAGAKGDTGAKLTFADLTQTDKDALKGTKGDKGDKGDTGATGATGATGPKGDIGAGDNLGTHIATKPLEMSNNNINNIANLNVNSVSTLSGKVYAKSTGIAPTDGISPLAINNATGELVKVASSTSLDAKPFTYIQYKISNVAGDYINGFNTKIPTDKYTVLVVGSSFDRGVFALTTTGVMPPLKLLAFQYNGIWALTADYVGTTTADNSNGTWVINCLVINNSMVHNLGIFSADMGGADSADAPNPPAGL